jgi:CheY-like chemotaxis protein/HPt (histidine-containing phosphotransfer) domain-containing protein
VPSYISGDITRLRQILLNLVSNGIKFTQHGKITINVSKIGMDGDKAELLFEVKDSGIGIPADKIDKLFKSFSQVDASTAKTYGGTGLGLAICKNLVALMGGKIWVESKSGNGSSFFFTIKTNPVSASDIPKNTKKGMHELLNARVLIISEDKTEINTFSNYFSHWGMFARATDNPAEALQWMRDGEKFNLAIIDAQMLTLKAHTVAERLRALKSKDELPVVLFNANQTESILYEYTDKIISAIIPQNVDRSKILDILISVFSVEEHQRSQQQTTLSSLNKNLAAEIPLRILIAEDNTINQKLAVNIFEGLGYKPEIANNGLEVIDKLKRSTYDIIFMDVQMPEMDGLETTKFIIEKMNLLKRPVIIAMTAFALEGDKEKCMEAGMDDYISKPFMIEEIVARIRKSGGEIKHHAETIIEEKKEEIIVPEIIDITILARLKELSNDNDHTFVNEVINMFLSQAPPLIEEMEKHFHENKFIRMGEVAHKLKGSSSNMGAVLLTKLCKEIELAGRTDTCINCEQLIRQTKDAFYLTALELRKRL